jgi:iron donor protein CyaY
MISSNNLEVIARKTLNHVADQLESQTSLDIDLQGLQLTVCGDMHQTFLLNFHGPTHQMWLSSPVTGAHHFHWDGTMWVSTRTATPLNEILSADIRQLFSEIVKL